MHADIIQALKDFSAGCNFSVLLTACVLFRLRRFVSPLHRIASHFFTYLAAMNLLLFFLFYVYDLFDENLVKIVNVLQATVIPFGVCLLHELTHPGHVSRRVLFYNLLPGWILLLMYAATQWNLVYELAIWAALLYGIGGLLSSIWAAHRYNVKLKEWSSYTEGIDLRWLSQIVWGFLGLFAVWIVASLINIPWVNVLYNFSICIIFAALAYCLSRQRVVDFTKENPFEIGKQSCNLAPQPFETMAQTTAWVDSADESTDKPAEAAEMPAALKDTLQARIHRAFEEKQIYLDKKLTIVRLAEEIGTNRTYLSNYINAELRKSFSDYVNGYRVNYAKKKLVENNAPLDVIAEMSGFNSLSSFRRMFTLMEGCTPGQYRRRMAKAKD